MAKRQFTASERFDLRQTLHVATIEALMVSRRWEPGNLVFHGGTSLHLVHGSPRYSEDLDFMVASQIDLGTIADGVKKRLAGAAWIPTDTDIVVDKVSDTGRMHSFVVSIAAPDLMTSVRVKVEMWRTDQPVLAAIQSKVFPVVSINRLLSGARTYVPASDLDEIYVDKVFAMGARDYVKARDVFDLHWLTVRGDIRPIRAADLESRFKIYSVGSPQQWASKSHRKIEQMHDLIPTIQKDLQRWLPSTWPLERRDVETMVQQSIRAMEEGIAIAADMRDTAQPPPAPQQAPAPKPPR